MAKRILALIMVSVMCVPFVAGTVSAALFANGDGPDANAPGISWKPTVPLKNAVLVNYDKESYVDDYAYLASVPTQVFYSDGHDRIYSGPLLFYQAPEQLEPKQQVYNAANANDYFMEDWETYAGGSLETVQLINVPSGEVSDLKGKWPANNYEIMEGDNAYSLAGDIAKYNWRNSDTAIVAVIGETFEEVDIVTEGSVSGLIPRGYTKRTEVLEGTVEPSPVDPNYHHFQVGEEFKYITSHMVWYGPSGIDTFASVTQRGKDPDLQLYDWSLGQVAASEEWNVLSGPSESIGSYIYNSGDWASAVTYMPTESLALEHEKQNAGITFKTPDASPRAEVVYEITNIMYPGVDMVLPDETPFYAREATFSLSWEGAGNLGLIVRGASGAELNANIGTENPKEVTFNELGDGQYSISVIKLSDSSDDITFTVSYSWHQKKERAEGDALASATEGAVLGSMLNAPLLYASRGGVPDATINALNQLGVKKVYLLDLGSRSGGKIADDLKNSRSILQPSLDITEITNYKDIYTRIKAISKTPDVVFSTINPWTYWDIGDGPVGEDAGALHLGPAAYAAAHHGAPVIITDMHSETSTTQAWHNHYWKEAYLGRYPPSVGCMVLTGTRVYRFLEDMGLDYAEMEPMLTVAGQFDIGTSWDRVYVGVAIPGRIYGSPVDAAQWVSRNALYQALIFANPGVSPEGVTMTTGSESRGPNGAVITKPEEQKNFQYPFLQSWVSYQHRFNERGSLYWGADYVTADGITPYRTFSGDPADIDQKYPDLTTSEVIPYYAEMGGFSSVYTTNFETTMDNLNKGTVMWVEVMHGGNSGAGVVGFWETQQKEQNPWRGYDGMGSTFEPDTAVMSKNTGLDYLYNPTASDRMHDGIIIAILQQGQTTYIDGYDFDEAMGNIHSVGFNAGSCLIANTFLHLALIRHGSTFQIIDPWLTSWYAAFAMEMFVKGVAVKGQTVGEAYAQGIGHVGIEYLTGQWWWDIFENVIYYGDPNTVLWVPDNAWDKPVALEAGAVIDGHAPYGTDSHPDNIGSMLIPEVGLFLAMFGAIGYGMRRRAHSQGRRLRDYVPWMGESEDAL